jgi:hypothetical protein
MERLEKLRNDKRAELEERRSGQLHRLLEYTTELGQRTLTMDPQSNRILLDSSGLMSGILDFDTITPARRSPIQSIRCVRGASRTGKAFRLTATVQLLNFASGDA